MQTYPTASTTVAPGGTASFIVWVWSTIADSSKVLVSPSVTPASYLGTPSFAIPPASGSTYTIASLPILPPTPVYEFLISVPVSTAAPAGASVAFTAKATATGALPFQASATEVVAAASSATSSSTSSVVPPLVGLPPIPGTSVAPVNPSQLFPLVNPSPGSGSLGLPNARSRSTIHAVGVSSTVPIDARLIGAQLVGLAVLAGAVAIAITRLSLRRRLATPATPPQAHPATAAPPTGSGQD